MRVTPIVKTGSDCWVKADFMTLQAQHVTASSSLLGCWNKMQTD